MATLTDVLEFSRAQALTDSNGLTNETGIIFANEALADFHRQLVKHGTDASQIQEAYVNTVTVPATGNGSTFAYPTDCLALKSIEVNFQDTTSQNYLVASQIDVSNIPAGQSFSWVRQNQSTRFPLFDDRGDWYEIFPAFKIGNNLTNAIRLFYYLKPTEFTTVNDTINYPSSVDYRILGWRIASSFLKSLSNFEASAIFDQEYQTRVKEYIASLGRGSQQPIQATPIQETGWMF